jgi:hypothetical protein
MPNLTFSSTTDDFNQFSVTGTIRARKFTTYSPELFGMVTLEGSLVIKVPRPSRWPRRPDSSPSAVSSRPV